MGMSQSVVFLRDKNDPDYQAKLSAFRACQKAGVHSQELEDYFYNEDIGVSEEAPLTIHYSARRYHGEYEDGFEVDVKDIPEGVKIIRFVNSY